MAFDYCGRVKAVKVERVWVRNVTQIDVYELINYSVNRLSIDVATQLIKLPKFVIKGRAATS